MEKYKVYICSGIFILLTAVKIFIPEHSQQLREQLRAVISADDDYKGMVEAMGRKLSEGEIKDELIAVLGLARQGTDELSPAMDSSGQAPGTLTQDVDPALPSTGIGDKELGTALDEAVSIHFADAIPEVVNSFIANQSEYASLALPATVSIAMPDLPFEYTSPVAGYSSSGFGYRVHPILNEIKFHCGTDFAANTGDALIAFADGYVHAAGESESYGKYLILSHAEGFRTVYAHLSAITVEEGSAVNCGDTIGEVGQSGSATGPHLHFELLQDDIYINPEYYV